MNASNMQKKSLLPVLNTIGYVFTIAVNYLANALPLNNRTTGELSAMYPNLFTPAGFTFSIWGIIYLALAAFVLYQTGIFGGKQKPDLSFVPRIGAFFFISSLANAGWIFSWHYMMAPLSMAVMLALLVSLAVIYFRLKKRTNITKQEYWFVQAPFSLYLGWISVATFANLSVLLVDAGVDGFGLIGRICTVLFIGTAAILGILFIVRRRDFAYGLVIVWALIGILTRHATMLEARYPVIIAVTALCLAAVAAAIMRLIRMHIFFCNA